MSSIIDTLITDRLDGYYNASDMNRVGGAMIYLSNRFLTLGYSVPVTVKMDWQIGDIPTASDLAVYIADLKAIRNTLAAITSPAPDDMGDLTAEEANDIERILRDVDIWLTAMASWANMRQSGTIFMQAGGILNA